ncbi:MAG: hypothetical protein WCP03_00230 [Candidatus Saccharibacteria bacterium]
MYKKNKQTRRPINMFAQPVHDAELAYGAAYIEKPYRESTRLFGILGASARKIAQGEKAADNYLCSERTRLEEIEIENEKKRYASIDRLVQTISLIARESGRFYTIRIPYGFNHIEGYNSVAHCSIELPITPEITLSWEGKVHPASISNKRSGDKDSTYQLNEYSYNFNELSIEDAEAFRSGLSEYEEECLAKRKKRLAKEDAEEQLRRTTIDQQKALEDQAKIEEECKRQSTLQKVLGVVE